MTVSAVTKRFPGVTALDDVSLTLPGGAVVGLVGENGAGKSTLTKILAGIIPASDYAGELRLNGQPLQLTSPADALGRGISLIPQELSLHADLSIAENVMLGLWPMRGRRVDWKALRQRAGQVVRRVGLNHPVTHSLNRLSPSEQQLVAIARALARDPHVLLLDEPTASLDTSEAKRLLEVVRALRDDGVTLLYVSHRLSEIFAVCDRVAVLRDGRVVCDDAVGSLDRPSVVTAMLGSSISRPEQRRRHEPTVTGPPLLQVSLRLPDPIRPDSYLLDGIDFAVRAGEVVGLVGLVGSGRTETLWSIFGALPREGEVKVAGAVVPADPVGAVRAGLGLLTEERRSTGLFPLGSVATNVVAASYRRLAGRLGWISGRREDATTAGVMTSLAIKASSARAPIMSLSGGNQQKALVGRWLVRDTRVLLLDEPARGIDVGAKAEMYALLRRLADQGDLAIVTTSSDVSELVGVCDRFLILREGRLVAEVEAADASEASLLELASTGPDEQASPSAADHRTNEVRP